MTVFRISKIYTNADFALSNDYFRKFNKNSFKNWGGGMV